MWNALVWIFVVYLGGLVFNFLWLFFVQGRLLDWEIENWERLCREDGMDEPTKGPPNRTVYAIVLAMMWPWVIYGLLTRK